MQFDIEKQFRFKYKNEAVRDNVIQGEKYRITIINSRLIRFEYSENDFVDKPTQRILNRDFGKQEFLVTDEKNSLKIETEYLLVNYNKKSFSKEGLSVIQKQALDQDTIWRFGQKDKKNLKGTTRTLDDVDGRLEMEDGINSLNGYGLIDDSKSLILNKDGTVTERAECTDIYFFGYGLNFRQALKDFYKLTGNYPEIPKYMLGNWWSRYWEYSEQSVMEIVNKFEECEIPLSVFIFDMDWHWVNIDQKYGSGWTGFSWNTELFPDPKRIIDWLHEKGIKVALNLHPADGVRAFEDDYVSIAKDMDVDPNTEKQIPFDVNNMKFMKSYFKNFIEKNEELGVDFWWLDWQQGDTSSVKDLDPLWMVNHLHYLHHAQNHEIPVTFSRYAGIGSHRYPIGFSGDTHVTWDSLMFQPEFTVNSANVGYNYWSHDIGGHMLGKWDEELYRRWIQFGVFTPIMRLHSGKTAFIEKEPWENNYQTQLVAEKYMKLRAKLVDFIYSENLKGSVDGTQLIEPLYFNYPYEKRVYDYKNQYMFGNQMLIAPVCSPKLKSINLSKVNLYLPKGTWYDLNGNEYAGESDYIYYVDELNYPVFRQPGSIVPLIDNDIYTLEIIPGNGQYRLKTNMGEYLLELKMEEDILTVQYPLDLLKEKKVSIKSLDRFELKLLDKEICNAIVKKVYRVTKKGNKVTHKQLIKLIKEFDLDIKIKNIIEADKYVLNQSATELQRINSVNCLPILAEQKEALITTLMKK